MATLADKIKNNSQVVKRGGQLFEAAPESLFATVQKQGLTPGAAVSPEVAASMGVTADQAKMAGSSAQMQKTIRESVAPQRQFKEAAPRMTASAEEGALRKKQQELEGLKELGTRVGSIVNEAVKEAAAAVPQAIPSFDADRLKVDRPDLTEEQLGKITGAITTGTVDAELYSIFNINPTDAKAGEQLAAELEKYKKTPAAQMVASAQALLGDDITLGQFRPEDWQALGLEGIGELSSLLGETEDALRTMPLKELQAKINQLSSADFGQVEDLQRIANDPFYPDNVRQAAQSQLRDLSSVGVQATEADMESLNEAVQTGSTFTVGGRDYTVAELLTDDTMASVVRAYLEDIDGRYKEEIEKELPELALFIKQNSAALKTASDRLKTGSQELASVQQDNAKLNSYGPVDLKEFNRLTVEGYDPAAPSNTRYAKTAAHKVLELPSTVLSDEDKTAYATFLSQMSSLSPEAAKQFSGLDLDGIDALVNASGLSWRDYLREYTNYQSNLNKLNNENLSSDRAVQEAFGGSQAYVDAQAAFKNATIMRTFSTGKLDAASNTLLSILDENGDGQIDDANAIREKLKTYYGSSVNVSKESIPSLLNKLTLNVQNQTEGTLYKLVQDGTIDNDELQKIIEDGMLTSRIYDLLEKKTGGLSTVEGGMDVLTRRLEATARENLTKQNVPMYASPAVALAEAQKWLAVNKGVQNRTTYLNKIRADIDRATTLARSATTAAERNLYQTTIDNLEKMRQFVEKTEIEQTRASEAILTRQLEEEDRERQYGQPSTGGRN